jgi:hypothetical protein
VATILLPYDSRCHILVHGALARRITLRCYSGHTHDTAAAKAALRYSLLGVTFTYTEASNTYHSSPLLHYLHATSLIEVIQLKHFQMRTMLK